MLKKTLLIFMILFIFNQEQPISNLSTSQNLFSPITTINFELPKIFYNLTLKIFNTRERLINILHSRTMNITNNSDWSANNIYFMHLTAD